MDKEEASYFEIKITFAEGNSPKTIVDAKGMTQNKLIMINGVLSQIVFQINQQILEQNLTNNIKEQGLYYG